MPSSPAPERPEDLVVYGGTGKAARDWPSFHAISRELAALKEDETLLVQSGRPVGVMRTHEWAPRVLIANSTRRFGPIEGHTGRLGLARSVRCSLTAVHANGWLLGAVGQIHPFGTTPFGRGQRSGATGS